MTAPESMIEITDLINRWAFARDQGRWAECADTFSPDGIIDVSWHHGLHSEFIEASRKGVANGFSKHMMTGTVVWTNRDRAYAETSVVLAMRDKVHGVSAIGTSYFRFLDKLERMHGCWKIAHRSAIYDADHVLAEHGHEVVPFDVDKLKTLPRPYRYLAYVLGLAGQQVPRDLPVAGSAAEATIRSNCVAWCASGA